MSVPRVWLGYPHPGTIDHHFHYSILRAAMSPDDFQLYVCGLRSGVSIARARNRLTALFLQSDSDYLLMCDTDGVWSPQSVLKLISDDVPIVSGHAMGQEDPEGEKVFSAVLNQNEQGHMRRKEEIGTGVEKVSAVGMHFTLIKREVMESLGVRPLWPYAPTINLQQDSRTQSDMGEDATFCMRAAAYGFDTYVDYDCPVGHVKDRIIWPPGTGKDPWGLDTVPEQRVEATV